MATRNALVFDLGASQGRTILGRFDGRRFSLEEVGRFDNIPVEVAGTLYWDVLRLYHDLKVGIGQGFHKEPALHSLGIDTWGVDFAFLDRNGKLLNNPVHHRDQRRHQLSSAFFELIPPEELFFQTGNFLISIMSVFQLFAFFQDRSPELEQGKTLLLMADLFNYFLTGTMANEYTAATTTLFYNIPEKRWERSLLNRFQFSLDIFPETVNPGTVLGPLQSRIAEEIGVPPLLVIAPGQHDTASAVAGIPVEETHGKWAFLSLGTWCVMGMDTCQPVMKTDVYLAGYGNEGSVEGGTFLARNITGLWVLQSCRQLWKKEVGGFLPWDRLCQDATDAPSFRAFIEVDDPRFGMVQPDMPGTIQDYCRETGQPLPVTPGEITRCVLESLVMKFQVCLEDLERLSGEQVEVLHVIGGGCHNQLLCQGIADMTGLPVLVGPVETTTIGNLLMQWKGAGEIKDLREGREIVRNSCPVITYHPVHSDQWRTAFQRYRELIDRGRK